MKGDQADQGTSIEEYNKPESSNHRRIQNLLDTNIKGLLTDPFDRTQKWPPKPGIESRCMGFLKLKMGLILFRRYLNPRTDTFPVIHRPVKLPKEENNLLAPPFPSRSRKHQGHRSLPVSEDTMVIS